MPAKAIGGVSHRHGFFLHLVDGQVGENLLLVRQMGLQVKESEPNQIVRAGIHVGGRSVVLGVIHLAPAARTITDGAVWTQGRARSRSLYHAERPKDLVRQKITIRLPADPPPNLPHTRLAPLL